MRRLLLIYCSLLNNLSPLRLLMKRAISVMTEPSLRSEKRRVHLYLLSACTNMARKKMPLDLLFLNSFVNSANWTNSLPRDERPI